MKSTTTANDTLNAFLRAIDPSWRSGATRYISLHTADPTAAGTQTSNESAYPSYARVAVTASTGFTAAASGNSSNTGVISFPQCTGAAAPITHVGIGTAASGAGQLIYSGELDDVLNIANLILPQFQVGALVASES